MSNLNTDVQKRVIYYGDISDLAVLAEICKTNQKAYIGFIDWRRTDILPKNSSTLIWFATDWIVYGISLGKIYRLDGDNLKWISSLGDASSLTKQISVSVPIGALTAGAEKYAQTFEFSIESGYTSAALAGFTLDGFGYTNCSITKCFLTGNTLEWSVKNLGSEATGSDLKLECKVMLIKSGVAG